MTDENNFKIKVNNEEEDKEIQDILLSLGFKWKDGDIKKNLNEKNAIFIYLTIPNHIGVKGIITYDIGVKGIITYDGEPKGDFEYFETHENKEITFKQLRDKKFQMKLKKILILNSLEEE